MNRLDTMRSNNINKMIFYYENLIKQGYACSNYGSIFNYYLSDKLNINYGSYKFHTMTDKWISFLWQNDKDNILNTSNGFIKEEL